MEDVVIENPFKFFTLPINVQHELMLLTDLESIKNLCATARLSKDPKVIDVFMEICDSEAFWEQKTKRDFPDMRTKIGSWRKTYRIFTEKYVQQTLIDATNRGDIKELEIILQDPLLTVESKGIEGETMLLRSVGDGNIHIVRYLLSQGADPNGKNNDGVTPLIRAAVLLDLNVEDQKRIIDTLIDYGADINAKTVNGKTALDHTYRRDIRNYLIRKT